MKTLTSWKPVEMLKKIDVYVQRMQSGDSCFLSFLSSWPKSSRINSPYTGHNADSIAKETAGRSKRKVHEETTGKVSTILTLPCG
jgi:hypothetical protein